MMQLIPILEPSALWVQRELRGAHQQAIHSARVCGAPSLLGREWLLPSWQYMWVKQEIISTCDSSCEGDALGAEKENHSKGVREGLSEKERFWPRAKGPEGRGQGRAEAGQGERGSWRRRRRRPAGGNVLR